MEKTTNYQLNKPEPNDPLRVADFNQNADLIDAALAGKAEKSAVTAVETALANKANAADVTALNQSVATLSTALGSGGSNCRIATGSYVGTGTYGADNPTSLTFPFVPAWVMIAECGDEVGTTPSTMATSFLLRPLWGANSTAGKGLMVTWSGKSVSWYCKDTVTSPTVSQNNRENYLYYWVAIGT